MAPAADGVGRDRGWLNSTETTRPGDKTDELSRGVFLLRKAPAPRRFTARKSFKPVVPDETVEGMERRHEAYVSCWRAADAHVSRVLADANADAFRRLEAFVVDRFDERAAMRAANGGETPQHLAQQIPAGLVLAGTFSALGTLPIVFLAEIGVAVALGVLLDTIVVRAVLVTALTLDLGRVMWWPSASWCASSGCLCFCMACTEQGSGAAPYFTK